MSRSLITVGLYQGLFGERSGVASWVNQCFRNLGPARLVWAREEDAMETMETLLGNLQNAAGVVRRKIQEGGLPPDEVEGALHRFFSSAEFVQAAGQYARGLIQPPLEFPLNFVPEGDPVGVDIDQGAFIDGVPPHLQYIGVRSGPTSGIISARLQPGYFSQGWTEEELELWLSAQTKYSGAGAWACQPFFEERGGAYGRICFFPDPPFSRWMDHEAKNTVVFPALKSDGTLSFFPIDKKMRKNDLVVLRLES